MTTVAENTNTGTAQKVNAVIAQQRRLLTKWEKVAHYLDGVVAGIYLPGIDKTFDNPVRSITGRRPLLLTLEGGDLNFAGAISRPKNNQLVYTPIFSYDLTMPYSPRGGGRVLPANNVVLARRANELLVSLIAYGQRVSFGMHENLSTFNFPTPVRNERGNIVAEDYSGVLGFELDNPAKNLGTVAIRKVNPAAKLLARHGVEFPMSLSATELEELVVEFRAEFGGVEIEWAAVVDALLFQRDYCSFGLPLDEAIVGSPESVVGAMRAALPPKYQWEASFNDLLLAARNPEQPVRISRLSAVQVFPVETIYDMPEDYAGTVLSPVDWAPPGSGSAPFAPADEPSNPPLVSQKN